MSRPGGWWPGQGPLRKSGTATPWKRRDSRIAARAGAARSTRTFGARAVQRAPVGELKFLDVDVDDAVVAVNGTVISGSLPTIAQGVTENTRIGRKCTIASINWRYTYSIGVTASMQNGETVRLMLVLDKQCNGAAAGLADIFETDHYQSFNNLANKGRFRTLMDRTIDINPQAAGGNGTANDTAGVNVSGSFFTKCKIPIEYDTSVSTGDVGSIRSNNLLVIGFGKTGGICVFDSKVRLRFTD